MQWFYQVTETINSCLSHVRSESQIMSHTWQIVKKESMKEKRWHGMWCCLPLWMLRIMQCCCAPPPSSEHIRDFLGGIFKISVKRSHMHIFMTVNLVLHLRDINYAELASRVNIRLANVTKRRDVKSDVRYLHQSNIQFAKAVHLAWQPVLVTVTRND